MLCDALPCVVLWGVFVHLQGGVSTNDAPAGFSQAPMDLRGGVGRCGGPLELPPQAACARAHDIGVLLLGGGGGDGGVAAGTTPVLAHGAPRIFYRLAPLCSLDAWMLR